MRRERVSVCGLTGLTGVQLSDDVDPRLIVAAARRRGQGLGSVLEDCGHLRLGTHHGEKDRLIDQHGPQ